MGTVRPSLTSKALIQMSKQEESISMSPNFEMEGGFLNQARGCLSRTGIRQGKRYQKYSRCCKTDFISRGIDFLFNFFLIWSMVCLRCHVHISCTTKWFSYSYILFLYSFPLWFIIGYQIQFSVLYSMTLLFSCSIYNGLHLLTQPSTSPLSQPPWQSPTPWQPQACSLCPWVCFCFVNRLICAIL